MKSLRALFLISILCFVGFANSENPLEQCRTQLDTFISKAKNRYLFPFPHWIQGHSEVIAFAEQNREALFFSEKFRDAPPNSSELFLYSNALESCKSLNQKLEAQMRRWLLFELVMGIGGLVLTVMALYLFWWLTFR